MYKVVIIEDEPWTRATIIRLTHWESLNLELAGEAADGEAGLELIHRTRPDIVITDVRMPRFSGIELVTRLRRENFQTPVLIISGYDSFTYVRSALKLGVTDYLLKPIKEQELNTQLLRCVQSLRNETRERPEFLVEATYLSENPGNSAEAVMKNLETALRLGNHAKIHALFSELKKELAEQTVGKLEISGLIGMYYVLLFDLQRITGAIGISFREMFREGEQTFVFSRENTMEEVMDFLEGLYSKAADFAEKRLQQRPHLDLQAVVHYVDENFRKGLTLEQTAEAFHVTKEYLSKAFKANMEVGFTEYLTGLRMQEAYRLIAEYRAPIKEVGDMVGYYDLAHFYKTFKRYFGKTPGEVRDGLKSDKNQANGIQ